MQDLRDAVRALRTAPLVSAVAILSLALGIGANTAIFSILNSLLLKPLPVREPHRLVLLASDDPNQGPTEAAGVNYFAWKELRDRKIFDHAFAWSTDRVVLSGSGAPVAAEAIWATGDFFEVLGVSAVVGRTLRESDDRRNGGPDGPVAVISYGFSHRHFGDAAKAVGRTLTIERVPFTIIGVTPPEFFGLNVGAAFDVVLPLETEPLLGRIPVRLESRYSSWLQIMARRGPAQSLESITSALQVAQPQIRQATMPDYTRAQEKDRYLRAAWTARAAPEGVSRFRRQYTPALVTLLAVVGLVLLVACANIATLVLARAAARRYEFSIRLAVGGSRLRLFRQLLAESVLLSGAGALVGLLFAQWGSRLFVSQLSTWTYTAVLDLSPDWRVLAVTMSTAVTTALLFGTAPAFCAVRTDPIETMRQTPRGLAHDSRVGLSGWLVVIQVALSLMLVVGAGLFLRSFAALAYRDLGFDRGRVVVAVVSARRIVVPAAERLTLYEHTREAAAAVPGVESAALSMATPLGSAGVRFTPDITMPGNPALSNEVRILSTPISQDWFHAFGTRLIAGRDFDARDRSEAAHVAIVNEAFVQRYLNGENPVGRTIVEAMGADRRPLEIIGLVENAAFTSVRDPIEPTMYRPLAQGVDDETLTTFPSVSVSVRAAGTSPILLKDALADAIRRVDSRLFVSFQTITETLNVYYIRERLLALLSAFFGAFALLLATLGLYGVTSYAVTRRKTELGIRMALGAAPSSVVRMVLRRVALLAGLGIAVGTVGSLWAARLVRTLLFDTPPHDPITFALAASGLGLAAAFAAWLPGRRAARIDPAAVLREG